MRCPVKKLYIFFLLFLLPVSCYNGLSDMYDDLGAKVPICVNLSAAIGGNGRGWAMAYNNLNTAIAGANAGDEIWVANPSEAEITATVTLNKSVALFGGFNGTEKRRGERNLSNKTVITGISAATAIIISAAGVVIDGFEIKNLSSAIGISIGAGFSALLTNSDFHNNVSANGKTVLSITSATVDISKCSFVSNSTNSSGAAIRSFNTNNIITIKDSIFKGNTADTSGGACYFENVDSLNISECTFGVNGSTADANKAGSGGALFIKNSNSVISDSFFYNNETTMTNGGAIFNAGSTIGNMQINNCTLSGNKATSLYGGAIYSGYNITIRNSNIVNNQGKSGGGIYIYSGNCVITGSNIVDNTATDGIGGGIHVFNGSIPLSLSVSDSTFISNTATIGNGGGIASSPAANIPLVIKSCRFESNTADQRGGAISFLTTNSSSCIINSLFYNNSSNDFGGAVYLSSAGNPSLTNLTFYSNQTLTSGGAIYGVSFSYEINNSVFYSNSKTSGGISADNVFISGGQLTLNYSFYNNGMSASPLDDIDNNNLINSSSPFISINNIDSSFLFPVDLIVDNGNDTAPGLSLVSTDLAGNNRKNGIVDIGAYERQ